LFVVDVPFPKIPYSDPKLKVNYVITRPSEIKLSFRRASITAQLDRPDRLFLAAGEVDRDFVAMTVVHHGHNRHGLDPTTLWSQ
jgi:hypothetical protein